MSDYTTGNTTRTAPISFFATPNLPAAAFSGVRHRRMLGFCVDFVLVSVVALLLYVGLYVGLFVVTLGLSAFFLPPLWPTVAFFYIVAFFYNGLTVSGRNRATPGMRMFDLEIRGIDGASVSFLMAGVHGVLLYFSWMFPPIFLASLFTPDKRCLHDIFAGVVVVRRPD